MEPRQWRQINYVSPLSWLHAQVWLFPWVPRCARHPRLAAVIASQYGIPRFARHAITITRMTRARIHSVTVEYNMDWESENTDILINPRMPVSEQENTHKLIHALPPLKSHVWVSTSGSSGFIKWAALSKKAILASATVVNSHLHSTSNDIWLNCLPTFHVGGLGVVARSYLSNASVIDYRQRIGEKWDPHAFYKLLNDEKITLTSLVPTQVYDLAINRLTAPPSLRAIIVGGGALSETLYQKARDLGWPLLPSYGLTETCSQVATAPLNSLLQNEMPQMQVLPHLQVSVNDQSMIRIAGQSILTGYAFTTTQGPQFVDPKQDGWFQTEDLGEMQSGFLHVFGRQTNFVKIGGESVDLSRLEKILETCKLSIELCVEAILLTAPDERLGHIITLATTAAEESVESLVHAYNEKVLPFEKIRRINVLEMIPKSPLGKVLKGHLNVTL